MNETQPQTATPTVLDWLFDHWWILLLVVAFLLLVLLYVLLVRARRTEPEAVEQDGEQEKTSTPFAKKDPEVDGLKTSFEKSLERLKAYVPGAKYRLQLPWYLLIGEEGLGKTTLLEHVALPLPMGPPSQPYRHDVNWWFFQDAVVLDVPGDYLLARDPGATRNRLWNAFLRLLQRHRRRRPIDGVILALPGPDLFGPEALTPEVIDYKAERIYEKLLDAQRILGLRFPIYVLFTRCDCIPSFQGYIHELPPAYRDTLFGWSNPYALDTVYSSDWAGEAFDTLAETLYRSQVELMADGMASDNPDGFFLFPTEFQQLRDPVRHYLDRIFRTSAYHDAFYLRGVYFTGNGAGEMGPAPALLSNDANGAAAPASSWEPPASETPTVEYRPRPVFLTQLFGAKIFAEFELAGPISQIFRWRHRTARRLQWASLLVLLVWGIGLLFAYNRLDHEINGNSNVGLIDVVPEIDRDLVDARRYLNNEQQQFSPDQEARFVARTLRLIEVFAELHASSLWSVFIPPSWFSSVDEDVDETFALAYEDIVFKLLHHKLKHQADSLIGASYRAPPLRRPPLLRLEEQPRFQEFRQFVQEMTALETQAKRYNRFDDRREKDLEHFAGIVEYLFRDRVPSYKMPSGFYDDADLYRDALGLIRIDSFRFAPYQSRADLKADNMVARLYVDLFAQNVLFVRLRQLERRLQTIRNIDDQAFSPAQETDTLFQTLRLIQDVEFWLDDPTLVYLQYKTGLDADTLSLAELIGPAFEELVARMDSSPFFNPDGEGYRDLSWRALEQAHKQMLALEIPPTTQHMLVPGQERALELSPDMLEVKNAIVKLLEQHAADANAPRRIPGFQDGYSLFWNLDLLEEAVALPDQYEDLNTSSEKALVTVLMTDRVARAATFVFDPAAFDPNASEEELRPQIQNFVAALPHLTKLLNVFQVLGARDQRLALGQLASMQAYTLLEQVYALLWASGRQGGVRRPFYSLDMAGANWTWKHGEPLYTAVFNTDDAATVEAYLAAQRERVRYLDADFARPLLVMLNSHHAQYAPKPPDLVSDWNQIAQVLQEYAQQQPGNSLSRLESFVGQVMQTTTPDSCLQVLAATTPTGEDYFLDRLLDFKVDLGPVCRGVALAEATTEYEVLRAEFDDVIVRRYPFDVQPAGPQLDPVPLRRFFNEYDPFAKTYLPYVEGNPDAFDPGLVAFFRDMAPVRAFFAPFLDNDDETAPPQYDFDVDFRVNLYREVSGSNIIEWQLMVDDRVIGIRDTVHTGSWTYGEPVRLVLRWAKDGPLAPVDAGRPNVNTDVEARRVTFEYLNRWALIAFLDQHRRRPFDPNPITLEFRIPVRSVGAPERVVPDTSVVFLRMMVRPPGSNEVLDFPTSFPRRIP